MIKARTWLTLLTLSVGTVAATASCGSDEATGGGSGGGSLITAGAAGKGGTGRAGAAGRAGANGTGSGGDSGASPTASAPGSVGDVCTANADCADGLTCLTPASTALGTGGPGNGLCTLKCDVKGTTDVCNAVSPGSACIGFGDAGYCLEACELGEPDDLGSKCHGRPDTACEDLAADSTQGMAPFCVPLCRADLDCGKGLYCQPSTGLCSKTKATGSAAGTVCDPAATDDPCKGFCIQTSATGVTPVTGNCVEVCSGGSPCMYTSGDTPVPGGLCIFPLSTPFGSLDLGICQPNCACNSDCKLPGDLCRAWASTAAEAQYKTELGASGLCYPNVTGSVALTCGGAGGGGTGGAGGGAGAGGSGGSMAGAGVAGSGGSSGGIGGTGGAM